MTDQGPTTQTLVQDEPIRRDKDEILQARQEVTVSRFGTLAPMNLAQQLEVAQTMAKAGPAVPAHLRGSPGACLACIEYSHGWGFMTYALARQSYVVKDILCFDSQVIHAVIEKFAPLHEDSLNFEFKGKDDQMLCVIWADCMIRGRVKKLEWESPEIGLILPKNSPLWKTKPKQQIFYNTSRDWARIHFPHVLLGAYSNDELLDSETIRAEAARDMGTVEDLNRKASGLAGRLAGRMGEDEGYHPDNVGGIKGNDRKPMGPIIDNDELANIAADVQPALKVDPQPRAEVVAQPSTESPEPVQEGKSAPAPAATPIDPSPAKPPEEKKPEPKTHDEYVAHLEAWLARAKDDAWIHDNYKDEKALRTRCGADITICNKLKNARLKELGAA